MQHIPTPPAVVRRHRPSCSMCEHSQACLPMKDLLPVACSSANKIQTNGLKPYSTVVSNWLPRKACHRPPRAPAPVLTSPQPPASPGQHQRSPFVPHLSAPRSTACMPSQQLLVESRQELGARARHMPHTSPPTVPQGRHFHWACLPPATHGQNDVKIRAGQHYKGGVQSRRGGKPCPACPTNNGGSGGSGGGCRIDFTQVCTKSPLLAAPRPALLLPF